MDSLFESLKTKMFVMVGAVAVFVLSAWSDEGLDTGKLKINGFGSHETGEILKGRHMNVDFAHQWLMREFANITANYTANEHFRLAVGMTARIWYETYPDVKRNPWFPRKQYFSVYPHVASGVFSYTIGDFGHLEMEFGYFPFKYNPDVRNLGEYLFRCNTYPPSMITNFDMTYSRLSGGRVSATFLDMVNLQVLLTQENELPSFYDPSLSVLADIKYNKIFDVGAGIMFDRFIAVDSLSTWAMSRLSPPSTYFDTVDSVTRTLSHAGIRMMSRFSLDFKPLIGMVGLQEVAGLFGENDLKLYGEAALLGLQDYQIYYQDWKKRIPRMIGFNWPTHEFLSYGIIPGAMGFSLPQPDRSRLSSALVSESCGLLFGACSWLTRKYLDWNLRPDLCAVELEYYGWDHSNGYLWVVMDGTAVPNGSSGDYTERDYNNDNWKWTVYMKKTFYRHSYVLLQFANDHWSLPQYDEKNYDRDEFCGRNTHWYWVAKYGVTF
jgi:hypothetical protein